MATAFGKYYTLIAALVTVAVYAAARAWTGLSLNDALTFGVAVSLALFGAGRAMPKNLVNYDHHDSAIVLWGTANTMMAALTVKAFAYGFAFGAVVACVTIGIGICTAELIEHKIVWKARPLWYLKQGFVPLAVLCGGTLEVNGQRDLAIAAFVVLSLVHLFVRMPRAAYVRAR